MLPKNKDAYWHPCRWVGFTAFSKFHSILLTNEKKDADVKDAWFLVVTLVIVDRVIVFKKIL